VQEQKGKQKRRPSPAADGKSIQKSPDLLPSPTTASWLRELAFTAQAEAKAKISAAERERVKLRDARAEKRKEEKLKEEREIKEAVERFKKIDMKKKGENRAIHEDIEKLVDQVRAVTTTTKEIEAKISGEVWDRQKRWELKRDVLFEATKRVAIIFDRLKNLDNVLQTEIKNPAVKDLQWKQLRIDENNKWFEATAGLEESKLFIGVSCGMDLLNAVAKFAQLTSNIAGKIYKGDGEIFKKSVTQLFDGSDAIRNAIRKELAIDGGAGSGS